MAVSALHLFPNASNATPERPQLRVATSNGKQPAHMASQSSLVEAATYGMSGMAFEVTEGADVSPMVIRPAASPQKQYRRTPTPTQPVIARHLPSVSDDIPMTPVARFSFQQPEPQSPHFSTPQRVASHRMHRSSDSIRRQEGMRGSPASQRSNGSNSPTLVRHNSDAGERADTPMQTYPMKSMFPQLQPGIPLAQQPYAPAHVPSSGLPRQQISKGAAASMQSLTLQVPQRPSEPGSILLPVASRADCTRLWELANGEREVPPLGKVQFDVKCRAMQNGQQAVLQPGIDLDLIDDAGSKVYQARLNERLVSQTDEGIGEITVQRCHPEEGGTFPVAQMDCRLPTNGFETKDSDDGIYTVTSIFPQIAALNSIKAVADSLQARSIAQFDPNAASPQAAQLAFDAVTGAKETEEANLIHRMPSQGTSSASGIYELQHPSLGPLHIAVEGRMNLYDLDKSRNRSRSRSRSTIPLGKIILRGPSYQGRTIDLASLDLANERVALDVDALCDLDSLYTVDSAVSALIAVAITESSRPENGGVRTHFSAPPGASNKGLQYQGRNVQRCPSVRSTASCGSLRARTGLFKREAKIKSDTDSVKLPGLVRGLLKLLGFSIQATIWVLGLGVKVLVKLLSCMAGGNDKA